MANSKKISELPESTANITDNDLLAIAVAQGGGLYVSNKITGQTLKNTFAGDFVLKSGDTMTGALNIYPPTGNANLNIGNIATPTTPFIDFHSSGENNDFDSRIIATGGNATTQQGTLELRGNTIYIKGQLKVTDVSELLEPGGGLETNTAGNKIKASAGDTNFNFTVDATGTDSGTRTFTKVGNITTATPPFLTMEGVTGYVNSNIGSAVPITVDLTSNVFGGKLAGGEPTQAGPTPIKFNNRSAKTSIDGNGFTVTQKFKNTFGVEIGMEFSTQSEYLVQRVKWLFTNCQDSKIGIRCFNSSVLCAGIQIEMNGTAISSFVSAISGGRLQLVNNTLGFGFKLSASLTSGAQAVFNTNSGSIIGLTNASQDPTNDYNHQIVFKGVPWKYDTYALCGSGSQFSQFGSPITREVSYFGTLYKINSNTAPNVISVSLNSIASIDLDYTNSGGTGGLPTVYPGDAIILDTGGQSSPVSLAGVNKTQTVAHALPVILT